MRTTGWVPVLRAAAAANGIPYSVFGDEALGLTDVVQCMLRWVYHPDDHSFNAIVSRIRVTIENAFAGQGNQFVFLSFFKSNKMGSKNPPRQFIVAAIFYEFSMHFPR